MAGPSPRYTARQVADALRETKGMVYLAAERLGCSHTTVYKYIRRHPSVQEVFEAERGKLVDAAELKLRTAVLEGEQWAVLFALRTLGKDRGYAERKEVTGADGNEVVFKVVYGDDGTDSPPT